MSDRSDTGCRRKCWQGAAFAGGVLFVVLNYVAGFGLVAALLLALAILAGSGTLLVRLVCRQTAKDGPVSSTAAAARASAAASPAAAAMAPTPQPDPADLRAPQPEAKAAPVIKPVIEPVIKPTTPLAGEAELAARKGRWSYRPDTA